MKLFLITLIFTLSTITYAGTANRVATVMAKVAKKASVLPSEENILAAISKRLPESKFDNSFVVNQVLGTLDTLNGKITLAVGHVNSPVRADAHFFFAPTDAGDYDLISNVLEDLNYVVTSTEIRGRAVLSINTSDLGRSYARVGNYEGQQALSNEKIAAGLYKAIQQVEKAIKAEANKTVKSRSALR